MISTTTRSLARGPRTERGQQRVGDDERGAAVLQDVGGLGRGEAEVDRDGDRPEGVRGEDRFEELGPVRHQDRDPAAHR
jgi:hypothetical protein